jgi:hypothetical protein
MEKKTWGISCGGRKYYCVSKKKEKQKQKKKWLWMPPTPHDELVKVRSTVPNPKCAKKKAGKIFVGVCFCFF